MNVLSIIALIIGIVLVLFVGYHCVDYLAINKYEKNLGKHKNPDEQPLENEQEKKTEKTASETIGEKLIIPEEITDNPVDEKINNEDKTDADISLKKTIFTEKDTIFIPNEKWIITVSFADNKAAVLDTYYLYAHDFIYTDKKFYVGSNIKNGVFLRSTTNRAFMNRGVANKHGIIFYDQDAGLVYKDLIGGKLAYYRRDAFSEKGIHKTCANEPYDETKADDNLINMVKITDGLELFIGKYVLTFINDGIFIEGERHREIKDADDEADNYDLKKTLAENSIKKVMKKVSKGIGKWWKKNS